MSTKRKSAFAIYAEQDVENKPIKHQNGNNHKSRQDNFNFKNNLKGISKRARRKALKATKINTIANQKDYLLNNNQLFRMKNKNQIKLPIEEVPLKIKETKKIAKQAMIIEEKPIKTKAFKQKILLQKNKKDKIKEKNDFTKMKMNGEDDEFDECDVFDSKQEAIKLFAKIIYPIKVQEFFDEYWEKKPLHIQRSTPDYYKNWFSCKEFDTILRKHSLDFTQNIDVTTYIGGVKENHNQEGRAYAPLVWDFFQQGCSIRFLNPQTYSKNLWKYLSLLQELFCSCVGANTYLTPAGTQGFAPHYDDIEAFALQLEGKKRWRVYKPINEHETLPSYSSRNFDQDEIGDAILDVILEAGDLLYFPRGWIHQANACNDIHSLHITVSSYQKNSYGDFFMKLMPLAVERAMKMNVEFRKGLPLNYAELAGLAHDGQKKKTKERKQFVNKIMELAQELVNKHLPIGAACDQMVKNFIHESLPPCFNPSELGRSIHGHGERWNEDRARVDCLAELEPDSEIKLIRRNCIRLMGDDKGCYFYHNLENTRIYQEKEPQFLEVESGALKVIEFLINSYPDYVKIEDLPMKSMDDKLSVASCLYDKGLIVTSEPLKNEFESDDDEECGDDSGDEQDERIDYEEDESEYDDMEDDQNESNEECDSSSEFQKQEIELSAEDDEEDYNFSDEDENVDNDENDENDIEDDDSDDD